MDADDGLDKNDGGSRWWLHVDAATGSAEEMEFTKPALMRRLDLPGRDLRMLDPFFAYPDRKSVV